MASEQLGKNIKPVEGAEQHIVEAVLTRDKVTVSKKNDVDALSSRGYGIVEKTRLTLAPAETLFLLDKGVIEVKQKRPKKPLGFQRILQHFMTLDENAWAKYLIYRDLRSRGYVVRDGFGLGIDFRVYERGEYGKGAATYVAYGVQEGKPVSMEELARVHRFVQGSKKKLVLAVLNRRGEVVYYSLSQLSMR